jgi:hypothetical protein
VSRLVLGESGSGACCRYSLSKPTLRCEASRVAAPVPSRASVMPVVVLARSVPSGSDDMGRPHERVVGGI